MDGGQVTSPDQTRICVDSENCFAQTLLFSTSNMDAASGFARAHFTVSKRAASGETLKMKHAGKNRRKNDMIWVQVRL